MTEGLHISSLTEPSSVPHDTDPYTECIMHCGITTDIVSFVDPKVHSIFCVWICIMRAWGWLSESRNMQPFCHICFTFSIVVFDWHFLSIVFYKHFGMENIRFNSTSTSHLKISISQGHIHKYEDLNKEYIQLPCQRIF